LLIVSWFNTKFHTFHWRNAPIHVDKNRFGEDRMMWRGRKDGDRTSFGLSKKGLLYILSKWGLCLVSTAKSTFLSREITPFRYDFDPNPSCRGRGLNDPAKFRVHYTWGVLWKFYAGSFFDVGVYNSLGHNPLPSINFNYTSVLPPSHRGRVIRFQYKLLIGVQKDMNSRKTQVLSIPFRFFNRTEGTMHFLI
jgi:hypothetical protein